MAKPYSKNGRWYLRVKDSRGRWRDVASDATTKTEAARLAGELQRREERIRLGLEQAPPEDGGGTLDSLFEWWLKAYLAKSPSYHRCVGTVRKHLVGSKLGRLTLVEVTSGAVETFLQEKSGSCSPQTLNHLRGYLSRAFNAARRAGRFAGANPVSDVRKRKVPKRKPDYLRVEEVVRLLAALPPRWRDLFAVALYTGLRKGELFGLRKSDVDLQNRLLTVARSYDRETTKGGHANVIPIASEAMPFFEHAIGSSPSELVFPAPNGSMMPERVQMEKVLRRAMAFAGITTGYMHKCRRKGCGQAVNAADDALRRCPKCNMKLWPAAQVRPLRFHHLRHSTASLLMMAGADVSAVQKILRHSDPRLTVEVYGHLAPEYLRAQIDRLSLGLAAPARPFGAGGSRGEGDGSGSFAASLLLGPENHENEGRDPSGNRE